MIYPIILCGGAGSRLWPASREMHPKPFIRVDNKENFLQKTFRRATSLPNAGEVSFVTSKNFFFETKNCIAEINDTNHPFSILSEPCGRDTLAAIAIAVAHISAKHGENATILVMPSDHLIENPDAYIQAVQEASALAGDGRIVTFGITPTSPETGYGYIESDGNKVLRFIEKPNYEKAVEFTQAAPKQFLWNSGMFCFLATTLQSELKEYASDVYKTTSECLSKSSLEKAEHFSHLKIDNETFQNVRKISFDYAIMEKTKSAAVVPCSIGWRDVGDWKSFSEIGDCDSDNNQTTNDNILINSTNCFIRSTKRKIAAVGVDNLAIIEEPDALLVLNKDNAQDVKKVYEHLKAIDSEVYKNHTTVHRPWGSYSVLLEAPNYKIKRIDVKPGGVLSLQMHHHRSEHWVVVSGMAKVQNGDDRLLLSVNESTFIPAGHTHRLENPGVLPLQVIEVQCGQYLGEDDIVRFEDIYERAEEN